MLVSFEEIDSLYTGPYKHVTIIAPGRGINVDGSIDPNIALRIKMTVLVARALKKRGIKVLIIWTGYKNLRQVRKNITIGGAGSEGRAYMELAQSTANQPTDTFDHRCEDKSTSTVANMALSAKMVPSESLILVVTDALHLMFNRVRFATELMFPNRHISFVSLPFPASRMARIKQALSALITRLGMTGVPRGHGRAILKRQAQLERATELFRRLLGR